MEIRHCSFLNFKDMLAKVSKHHGGNKVFLIVGFFLKKKFEERQIFLLALFELYIA